MSPKICPYGIADPNLRVVNGGLMAKNIKAHIKKIKYMVLEFSHGQMEQHLKGNGKTIFNTEKVKKSIPLNGTKFNFVKNSKSIFAQWEFSYLTRLRV